MKQKTNDIIDNSDDPVPSEHDGKPVHTSEEDPSSDEQSDPAPHANASDPHPSSGSSGDSDPSSIVDTPNPSSPAEASAKDTRDTPNPSSPAEASANDTRDPSDASSPAEAPAPSDEEEPEEPTPESEEERIAENEHQEPVVTIHGLKKSFKDHDVLRGVDLEVRKGENLVVLGKSGSGKSVLIKCLVGLEYPDEGEIKVLGQDISTLKYDELNALRVRVGFLFQNSALYDSMTVRENLAFPLRKHKKTMTSEKKEAVIMEMLENVGLEDSIDQMPSKLSGGQNKRIGLARTLILRPEIMLYDEPTTGLDTGTSREISELMVKMKQKYNISSITITHDMPCAKLTADRIIMMKEGLVVAEGTYEELEKSEDEWIRSFFH